MIDVDLDTILPQKPPMRLIEKILQHSGEKLVASLRIRENSFGFEKGGVPSWFGVEYMAQSVAAFSGLQFFSGGKPEIGFLVGVRNYIIDVESFKLDSEIQIHVVPGFVADNSGSFDCSIQVDGIEVVKATITTYKPSPLFLAKLKEEIHE